MPSSFLEEELLWMCPSWPSARRPLPDGSPESVFKTSHARSSISLLCRGDFAFFTEVGKPGLGAGSFLSLHWMTLIYSCNWIIASSLVGHLFRCGVFWFPEPTFSLAVCTLGVLWPPHFSPLSLTQFLFAMGVPLFPLAFSAYKHRWNSSNPDSSCVPWESWENAHTIPFLLRR